MLGQLFLAVALVALAIVLGLATGHARLGLGAAGLAFLLSLVNLGYEIMAPDAAQAAGGFAVSYALAALSLLVALVALGIAARQAMRGSRWALVPLALGLGQIPLLALGAALESVEPRLLEVPILLLGVGHLALAGTLAAARDAAPPGAG